MKTILLIAVTSILNIVCFFIGAKIGQKTAKGEEIKVPNLNPVTALKNYEAKKEEEAQAKKYNEMIEEINNYDGNVR